MPSMAEFEDDPVGKYPTRTAKRLKVAAPPSVKRLRLKRFGGSFRVCLLVAVAVLGLVLLWPVCLVWVSSSLLLAFSCFKRRAATQEPTNFSSGSGDPAVWHRPENRNLFWYPLAVWDFGSLHQKPWVGGTFCRVLRDGSGGWQSPVPQGDNTGGRVQVPLRQPSSACPADWFRTS